jgi:cell shape-determining protein MreC
VVDQVTRLPQESFAEVTATPAAALDQVREVMLIWVRKQDPGADDE